MSIPRLEFEKFLTAFKKAGSPCAHCGGKSYAICLDNENRAAEVHLAIDNTPAYHGFFMVTCEVCGRTDLFHERQVKQWIAANAKED
jgi:predicted nucleic-acid-binding Zn-ribbon protein